MSPFVLQALWIGAVRHGKGKRSHSSGNLFVRTSTSSFAVVCLPPIPLLHRQRRWLFAFHASFPPEPVQSEQLATRYWLQGVIHSKTSGSQFHRGPRFCEPTLFSPLSSVIFQAPGTSSPAWSKRIRSFRTLGPITSRKYHGSHDASSPPLYHERSRYPSIRRPKYASTHQSPSLPGR